MAPRSNRRSGNLLSVKVLKTDKLNRTRAKRIPSRPGVVKHPNKAVYIRADLTCYSHFSLATRRRTIHTENAILQAVHRKGDISQTENVAMTISCLAEKAARRAAVSDRATDSRESETAGRRVHLRLMAEAVEEVLNLVYVPWPRRVGTGYPTRSVGAAGRGPAHSAARRRMTGDTFAAGSAIPAASCFDPDGS